MPRIQNLQEVQFGWAMVVYKTTTEYDFKDFLMKYERDIRRCIRYDSPPSSPDFLEDGIIPRPLPPSPPLRSAPVLEEKSTSVAVLNQSIVPYEYAEYRKETLRYKTDKH